jgi:hypothetical protein
MTQSRPAFLFLYCEENTTAFFVRTLPALLAARGQFGY